MAAWVALPNLSWLGGPEAGDLFKKFHRAVLQDGSAPLSVLDARVRAWIASEKG
jgi:hypothetical protein